MADCNAALIPADLSIKLVQLINKINIDTLYQQAVRSLIYLMLSLRPDISAAINKVT